MRSLGTIRNLAGGRVPPLTRTALLAGLAVFVAALALVRPTDGGLPPAEPLRGGVRWVAAGNGVAEGVVLLDPSVAYLPSKLIATPDLAFTGTKLSEETPFTRLDRRLTNDPLKSADPPLKLVEPVAPRASTAVPLTAADPFTTFGRANLAQSSLAPRAGSFEVFELSGAKKSFISGILPPLELKNINKTDKSGNNAPLWSTFEAIVGVDSLGLQGQPAVIRSSGHREVDQALTRWATGVPWAKHLPPGSYRLFVSP